MDLDLVYLCLSLIFIIDACHCACPNGWTRNNDKCYYFSSEQVTWFKAQKICESKNSKLAEPRTIDEVQYLNEKSRLSGVSYWIGVHENIKTGEWIYATMPQDRVVSQPWGPGEPNHAGENEHCLDIFAYFQGKWNNEACNHPVEYACETSAEATTTSIPPVTTFQSQHSASVSSNVDVTVSMTTLGPGYEQVSSRAEIGEIVENGLRGVTVANTSLKTRGKAVSSSECPASWTKYNDKCYYFSTEQLGWFDAQKICESKNSKLAEPRTNDEVQYLNEKSRLSDISYYIGVHENIKTGEWVYASTQEPVVNQPWGPGEPNNYNEHCLDIFAYFQGKWNNEACKHPVEYVCEKSAYNTPSTTTEPPTTPSQPLQSTSVTTIKTQTNAPVVTNPVISITSLPVDKCNSGWTERNDKCYFFSSSEMSWFEAQKACLSKGSMLAEPVTDSEQQYLATKSEQDRRNYWVGIHENIRTDQWVYASNTKPVTISQRWGPNEPNSINEHCIDFFWYFKGGWNNDGCKNAEYYICEKRKAVPTQKPSDLAGHLIG